MYLIVNEEAYLMHSDALEFHFYSPDARVSDLSTCVVLSLFKFDMNWMHK